LERRSSRKAELMTAIDHLIAVDDALEKLRSGSLEATKMIRFVSSEILSQIDSLDLSSLKNCRRGLRRFVKKYKEKKSPLEISAKQIWKKIE
jgi:hypothetical protein